MKKFGKILAAAFLLSGVVTGGLYWYATREPTVGGDFTLRHRAESWNFSAHAKKLNLLYIGYAKCPDVCPMTLGYASQAFHALTPEQAAQAQLIFLSVDTAHDTPDTVADYAAQFFPGFVGITGDKNSVDGVVSLFGAGYTVETNAKSYLGYSISHTDRLYYLDKKGRVVNSIPGPRSADLILTKIKEHL